MTRINSEETFGKTTKWIWDGIWKAPKPFTPLDEYGDVDPVRLSIMLSIAYNALKMIAGGPEGERVSAGIFQRKLIAAYTLVTLDNPATWNHPGEEEPAKPQDVDV